MKLRAIRLHNVRRFTDRGIAIENIDDGVNVLAESNEYGKSTVFDAVHALFFQPHKGKPKAVQLLQPYSKGAVTVEADIDTPEGLYRLRKRWYGSALAQVSDATGRIIAQADEADRWIDARIRGGATGPAGLLWVQQGAVEMGQTGGKAAADEMAAREDVFTSVSGEIETLTGGRRTTQVLAKCIAELDAYVTATGRPKAGGVYAKALEKQDALNEIVTDMEVRVRDLRTDLDSRTAARKRLVELQDAKTLALDTAALAEAETELKQAEEHASRLEAAMAGERIAQQERDLARQALERHDASVKAIADLTRKVTEGEAALAGALETTRKIKAKADETALRRQTARTTLQAAGEALERARAATVARAAATQLESVQKTLAAAENARGKSEEARAAANALALPKGRVDALAKLDEQIAAMTAEQRVASASVGIAYTDPAAKTVRHGGEPLSDGATLPVDEQTMFEIEGVGVLTVTPGTADRTVGLAEKLRVMAEERQALLTELGIDSHNAAHKRQADAETYERIADDHASRLDALAPDGLDALKNEVARLEVEAGDVADAVEPLETLSEQFKAKRAAAQEAEDAQDTVQATLGESEKALARLEVRLAADREALARETPSDDPEGTRTSLSQALAAKASDFETAHGAAATLRDNAPDLDTARARHKRAATVVTRTQEEIDTLRTTISTLNGSIGARAEEGIEEDLTEKAGRRDRVAARVAEIEIEINTLTRLRDVLTAAKADAKDHFFEPVLKELKPLLQIVFGEAAITFDETTLLPIALERAGIVESFDVLSGGMREQITILTRLAFARLLAQDGRTVPIILDDALIFSDDDRIERMFTALHRQAADLQIIVFTCRQRAFHQLGGRALSIQTWSPEP